MKKQILTVPIEELFARSEAYFMKMCGFDRDLEGNKDRIAEAVAIREHYKEQFCFHCMLTLCPKDCVCKNEFQIEGEKIFCQVLSRIPEEDILQVYLYGICLEDIAAEGLDMLEEFYLDTWMTAMVDAGRDWMKDTLTEENVFLTEAFGPGFYGIGIDQVPVLLKILDGSQIGLVARCGTMVPSKSNVGFYLALSKETSLPNRDCASCLSSRNTCEFCKNYVSNEKKKK